MDTPDMLNISDWNTDFESPQPDNFIGINDDPMLSSQQQTGTPIPLTDAEYREYIEKYPFAAEPTYFTRPNRYYGPASTWRSWTQPDRSISDSLEQIEAADLSIHLYNSFILKQKALRSLTGQVSKTRSRSRSRGVSGEGGDDSEHVFAPPDTWTTWPLPPDQVPRLDSRFNSDAHEDYPSSHLDDALLAATLRHARRTWDARPIETTQLRPGTLKRDWSAERVATQQEIAALDVSYRTKPEDDRTSLTSSPHGSQRDSLLSDEEGPVPEGIQTFSSQPFGALDQSTESEFSSETDPEKSQADEPVFSVDDDHARDVLQPSIRHTLVKLDDLLLGLHKARLAYAQNDRESRSRSQSTASRPGTTDDERFIRSGSRSEAKKSLRKRKRSLAPAEITDNEAPRSISRGRSTSRSSRGRKRNIGPRDWSDVLGMAALTGWKKETIARASERCARLFNENMMFRIFPPPDPNQPDSLNPSNFEEEYALGEQPDQHPDPPSLPSPIPSQPPQHNPNLPRSSQTKCPYHTCPLNTTIRPFPKNWQLQRHLALDHGHRYSPPPSPANTAHLLSLPVRLSAPQEHPLTCPIESCPQHKYQYTRRTRLYDHIRAMHPAFDLKAFKAEVARRSGKRGKYDRSRFRNPQRTGVANIPGSGEGGPTDGDPATATGNVPVEVEHDEDGESDVSD